MTAKADLDNFYHRLGLPAWARKWFALPPVPGGLFGLSAEWVYPCCCTLPMGASHAVYLAQIAHEHLLLSVPGFDRSHLLTTRGDLSLSKPGVALYVDDLILLALSCDADVVRALLRAYIATVSERGLVVKTSKLVWPTSEPVECLGVEVRGSPPELGVSPTKLQHLQALTYTLLAQTHVRVSDVESLVGSWTWAFLVRRPALSVFSAVYRFVRAKAGATAVLWPSVRKELALAAALAPLLWVSLSAACFSDAIAVDASGVGLGVVATRAQVPSTIQALPLPLLSSDAGAWCASVPWRVIVSSHWRKPEHINVLELRTFSTAIRWVLSHPGSVQVRLQVFTDSTVAGSALAKGRSSSFALNKVLRSIAAVLLASGCQINPVWIPTDKNPADGPSRDF